MADFNWVDLWDKATEVEEAAAAAMEAENERFREGWELFATDRMTGRQRYDVDDIVDEKKPYPYDPFDLAEVDEIWSRFAWLAVRDSTTLDAMIGHLSDAHDWFSNAYTAHSDRESAFTEFSGHFIGDLSGYLDNMDKAAARQSELCGELQEVALNAQEALNRANYDLANLADRAVESLDDIADGGSGAGSDVLLALAGMTIGVIAAAAGAPTGGATLPISFALLSGGLGVLGAVMNDGGIEDSTVDGVLNNMFDKIDDRKTRLTTKEDELIGILHQDDQLVTEYHDIMEPHRPSMADERGDLAPTGSGSALVAGLATLRYYAREDMPRMASDFAGANHAVAAVSGAGGAAALGDIYAPLLGLCQRLQRMSGRTSDNIFDAADVVAAAATDFARQDGITGAELKAEQREVERADSEADSYTPKDRKRAVMPDPALPDNPYAGRPRLPDGV